jgi:hypothetical protein
LIEPTRIVAVLPLTLRLAESSDADELRRLAERDSTPLPPGPHLVAVREGVLEAAISLESGAIVADPFRRTAETCELLRLAARPAKPKQPARVPRQPVLRERLA